MKNWKLLVTALAVTGLGLVACGPKSSYGFRLPDGNAQAGLATFKELQCTACHVVVGEAVADTKLPFVVLGGEVTRVQTYGELVTSIINPSHKISVSDLDEALLVNGQSAMESIQLNKVMTVEQLADLVAYLQPTYRIKMPKGDPYGYIYN